MSRGWLVLALLVLPAVGAAQAPVRLSLSDALRMADSASEPVGIARAGVRGAAGRMQQARSGWLPQLNGSVLYTRTLETQFAALQGEGNDSAGPPPPSPVNCVRFAPDPTQPLEQRLANLERGLDCTANGDGGIDFSNLPFGRPNQWTFGLEASQTLFDPTLAGRIRAARAGATAAEAALEGARTQAVLEAALAYTDAQLAERLLDIAELTLEQAERSASEVELARRVGTASEFDELRAGVARDNQKPIVILRRTQRDQAFLRLRQLLDLPPTTAIELTTPLGDSVGVALPAHVMATAMANDTTVDSRVAVREANAAVDAAEGALSSTRGNGRPSVRLSSSYAKLTFPDEVFRWERFLTDWTASVRVSVPLFTGGRVRGEVLAAEAAADEARLRARQVRELAEREVIEVQDQLAAAEALWEASRSTADQASRAYAIAEVRVREGLSTQTDLNDARLQQQQAEANRAQAARDLQVARLRALLLRDLPVGAGAALMGPTR